MTTRQWIVDTGLMFRCEFITPLCSFPFRRNFISISRNPKNHSYGISHNDGCCYVVCEIFTDDVFFHLPSIFFSVYYLLFFEQTLNALGFSWVVSIILMNWKTCPFQYFASFSIFLPYI